MEREAKKRESEGMAETSFFRAQEILVRAHKRGGGERECERGGRSRRERERERGEHEREDDAERGRHERGGRGVTGEKKTREKEEHACERTSLARAREMRKRKFYPLSLMMKRTRERERKM